MSISKLPAGSSCLRGTVRIGQDHALADDCRPGAGHAGTIRPIRSARANGLAPKDRNIAMVFQSPALYPHMTVYRNLAFSLAMWGIPKPAIRDAVLQTARCWESVLCWTGSRGNCPAGNRSESPWAGLGAASESLPLGRAAFQPRHAAAERAADGNQAIVRRAWRDRDLRDPRPGRGGEMALGGRIVVLYEGRVQQVGSPLDVFQHPRNRFVAQFLGSPPMHLLGEIVAAEGGLWFTSGPLSAGRAPWDGRFLGRSANEPRGLLLSGPKRSLRGRSLGRPTTPCAARSIWSSRLGSARFARRGRSLCPSRSPSRLPRRPSARETVQLHFDLERFYFFSAESGENLADPALIIAPATPGHGEP